MAAIAIPTPPERLGRPLALSLLFHGLMLGWIFYTAFFPFRRGAGWGNGVGGEGAISVTVVRSLPGIPLPSPEAQTLSKTVDLTRGLYKSEPKPKVREPEATKLPKFEKEKPERYVSRPSRVDEVKEPPLVGAIPYGQGGAPALPYGQFQVGTTSAGMEFGAEGGFGEKFPWYVDAVRRRISSNWLITTIDPSIQWAPRVMLNFEIARDGSVLNLQFLRRSGLASVDRAALRAVLDSSPLDRLPSEYRGGRVSVEFWFDFRR